MRSMVEGARSRAHGHEFKDGFVGGMEKDGFVGGMEREVVSVAAPSTAFGGPPPP